MVDRPQLAPHGPHSLAQYARRGRSLAGLSGWIWDLIKACGKFSLRGGWILQHGAAPLQRGPFADSPKESAPYPLGGSRSRGGGDAEGVLQASSNYNEFLFGIWWEGPQRLFPPVLQDQRDRFPKASEAFFPGRSLTVGSGHFGAISNVPRAIPLDNRRELIAHAQF